MLSASERWGELLEDLQKSCRDQQKKKRTLGEDDTEEIGGCCVSSASLSPTALPVDLKERKATFLPSDVSVKGEKETGKCRRSATTTPVKSSRVSENKKGDYSGRSRDSDDDRIRTPRDHQDSLTHSSSYHSASHTKHGRERKGRIFPVPLGGRLDLFEAECLLEEGTLLSRLVGLQEQLIPLQRRVRRSQLFRSKIRSLLRGNPATTHEKANGEEGGEQGEEQQHEEVSTQSDAGLVERVGVDAHVGEEEGGDKKKDGCGPLASSPVSVVHDEKNDAHRSPENGRDATHSTEEAPGSENQAGAVEVASSSSSSSPLIASCVSTPRKSNSSTTGGRRGGGDGEEQGANGFVMTGLRGKEESSGFALHAPALPEEQERGSLLSSSSVSATEGDRGGKEGGSTSSSSSSSTGGSSASSSQRGGGASSSLSIQSGTRKGKGEEENGVGDSGKKGQSVRIPIDTLRSLLVEGFFRVPYIVPEFLFLLQQLQQMLTWRQLLHAAVTKGDLQQCESLFQDAGKVCVYIPGWDDYRGHVSAAGWLEKVERLLQRPIRLQVAVGLLKEEGGTSSYVQQSSCMRELRKRLQAGQEWIKRIRSPPFRKYLDTSCPDKKILEELDQMVVDIDALLSHQHPAKSKGHGGGVREEGGKEERSLVNNACRLRLSSSSPPSSLPTTTDVESTPTPEQVEEVVCGHASLKLQVSVSKYFESLHSRWRKWLKRFKKVGASSLSLAEAQQLLQEGESLGACLDIRQWLVELRRHVDAALDFTNRARVLLDQAAAAAVASAAERAEWSVGSLDAFRRKGQLQQEDFLHVLDLQQQRKEGLRNLRSFLKEGGGGEGGGEEGVGDIDVGGEGGGRKGGGEGMKRAGDGQGQPQQRGCQRRATYEELQQLVQIHGKMKESYTKEPTVLLLCRCTSRLLLLWTAVRAALGVLCFASKDRCPAAISHLPLCLV